MTSSLFAELFPRLSELKDAVPDPTHPDAYFRGVEKYLRESPHVVNVYKKLEHTLARLDADAWRDLKARAVPHLTVRGEGRGWQAMFDIFNEAKGYVYLQNGGCVDIAFIKRSKKKTPDLRGSQNGTRVLCEVKTINVFGR